MPVLFLRQAVIIGSPVFYYDTPDYVKGFISSLPDLNGIPVAS